MAASGGGSAAGFVVPGLPPPRVPRGATGGAALCCRVPPPSAAAAAASRASTVAGAVLLGAAVGLLSVTPAGAAQLGDGQTIFEKSCAACHAGGGNIIGFSRGKTLKTAALSKYGYDTPEAVAGLVRSGKGVMPGYDANQLSDSDVSAVSQFVIDAAGRGWK